MKFDILYSRLGTTYLDGQERRALIIGQGCDGVGVPKFPYLSSNNGNFSKISFLFLYYNIKVEKSQIFDIVIFLVVFLSPLYYTLISITKKISLKILLENFYNKNNGGIFTPYILKNYIHYKKNITF